MKPMKNDSSNEKLEITTPSDREIVMTREFDAPRSLVFDAWTKPELLKRWFGPRGYSLTLCEIDLRVGGAYRFVMRNPTGREIGWGGVYREIAAPERMVQTEVFDDAWYPGEALNTTVLVERDGKTTLISTMTYATKDARDGVLKSGMELGVAEAYAQLDEFLLASSSSSSKNDTSSGAPVTA